MITLLFIALFFAVAGLVVWAFGDGDPDAELTAHFDSLPAGIGTIDWDTELAKITG